VLSRSSFLQSSLEYDAIIIGAGHNGLTCGCYLAKAGLRVLILEEYHSIGGMTITEDITLPGFKSDIHAFGYQLANVSPVPNELDLDKFGFELIYPEISFSHIFPNGRYISMYKSLDKTIKSIEKFSVRDARTWHNMFNTYLSDRDKIISSINSPPADLRIPVEKIEQLEYRQGYTLAEGYRKQLQSMRSWCDENFESDEAKVVFGTFAAFVGLSPDDAGGGELCHLFASIIQDKGNNVVRGGFVNLPKALAKFIESRDGAIMTNASVSKITIENGKAMGVILANGKSITAKKLVASSTDPSTLILKLIGEDYVDSAVINSIKRIEWGDSVFGIYLALDGRLEYRSDEEVSRSSQIHLSPPTLEYFSKIFYECRSGMIPNNPLSIMSNDSIIDPSRVPPQAEGTNQLIKFLILSVPYDIKSYDIGNNEKAMKTDWSYIKEQYSDQIIDMITQDYIPNLKSIVSKKVSYSPLDYENKPTTCIKGTLSCGAVLPYQSGSMRPIPQLSNYRVPSLQNVYLCGSGNHPGPGVSMAPGRNAAQVILSDLGIDFKNLNG
jgi:beta-carotene ketolase (CrtO type)